MSDYTTDFDLRIANVPEPWRAAIVEVIDTAEVISIALEQKIFGNVHPVIESQYLVAELTRMVLETVKADQQKCTE